MPRRRILLIGWDAADWKVIRPLMEAGKMPNVQRLVENGSSGPITTLHPPLSPMLWTSIATGKRPFKHGIHGFTEPTPDGRGVQPITNLSRKSKALWNIFSQQELRSIVIGWWPSHPAEPINGVMVSDHYHRASGPLERGWPLPVNAVHPIELVETIGALRMHPDSLTPEMVEPFIPLASEIDQDNDQRLALFLRTLAECMSIHTTALSLIENEPWDFAAVYLDAIDHFCHGFMRYHPPRQSWITERDFELYQNVVSTAYQLHDRMLGELLAKAGEDTTVILMSDHGFHPDHLRPASIPDIPAGPAVEHRDLGILVIRGPDIKQGRIDGASVLDIAPTVLSLFGLPVGEDMDGKVLLQAYQEGPAEAIIPSWEDMAGADGRHPPHTRLDPVAAHAAMEQMIALGYVERPNEDRGIAVAKAIRELRYNLGESYQDAARHREAHEIFTELYSAEPNEQRFAVRLFVSCQALGKHAEMRRIIANAVTDFQPAVVDYLRAQVFLVDKRYDDALAALERVTEAQMVRPSVSLQTADLYLRLRRSNEAREMYEKALAIDPDNTHAHLGLSRVALGRRRYAAAAQAALDALQCGFNDPQAHFLLGSALKGLKQYERAADAFRAAISLNPNFPEARRELAAILPGEPMRRRSIRIQASEIVMTPTPDSALTVETSEIPPLAESLIVVTGLPRSGTSMLMQMLDAGGINVLSDGLRDADEHNPRGYLEFEPVKALLKDSNWLFEARGKAVKIVLPLLTALPEGLACRVILCERDLGEVLDSQARMLARPNQHRDILRGEYARMLTSTKAMLSRRPQTQLLVVEHREAISQPFAMASKVNQFLGAGFDVQKMAAAIDPTLHRSRAAG